MSEEEAVVFLSKILSSKEKERIRKGIQEDSEFAQKKKDSVGMEVRNTLRAGGFSYGDRKMRNKWFFWLKKAVILPEGTCMTESMIRKIKKYEEKRQKLLGEAPKSVLLRLKQGLPDSTLKEIKRHEEHRRAPPQIEKIVKKLSEIGVEGLATQILRSLTETYPHAYPSLPYLSAQFLEGHRELALIFTSVEGKVRLEHTLFLQKFITEEEAAKELLERIKEGVRSGSVRFNSADSDTSSIFMFFFWKYRYIDQNAREKIEDVVKQRWSEIFPAEYEALSLEEKKTQKIFWTKTIEELAGEMACFFEKREHWSELLDRSMQGRRNYVFKDFWSKKYPGVDKIPFTRKKRWDAEFQSWPKLKEVEKRVYNLILESFLEWAEDRNLLSISRAEEREFLEAHGLLDTCLRFQDDLRIDVNHRLKKHLLRK